MFYGSADQFVTYHLTRGKTLEPTWDVEAIESALLVASEWLDNAYDKAWCGYPTGGYEQERKWPRTDAYTNTFPSHSFATTDIPNTVLYATYEAAFRHLTKNGSLQLDFSPLKYKSVSIDGAISVEYNTALLDASDVQITIPIITSLMSPLLSKEKADLSDYSGPLVRV